MAFKTLDLLRTAVPGLNSELGLATDGDNAWGTTGDRNAFIQRAIAKLWPRVARLTRETVTTLTNIQDYTLTTIVDAERLEVIDPGSAGIINSRIKSWQLYADETGDPPVQRLLIPAGLSSGLSIRVIGYVPYLIPANGAASCDIPPRLEWLVIAGARVEAYRAMVNKYANFERFQNENRQNALSAADVLELLRQAGREWSQGLQDNARNLTGAHRAQLQTS